MSYDNLTVTHHEMVGTITINRPEKLNTLTNATLDELEVAIDALDKDDGIRAVLITGAGERAFVAGADIKELANLTVSTGHLQAERGQNVFRKIEKCGKPVLAAINGFALGGGLELALACHLRVSSDTAKLGLPEVGLGIIPGYGGTQRLSKLVGRGKATELILTGRHIDAVEAYRIGLVNHIVPPDQVLSKSEELLKEIVTKGPLAVRHALFAVDQGLDLDLDKGLSLEATLFGLLFATSDTREGLSAFIEKRPAAFEGK